MGLYRFANLTGPATDGNDDLRPVERNDCQIARGLSTVTTTFPRSEKYVSDPGAGGLQVSAGKPGPGVDDVSPRSTGVHGSRVVRGSRAVRCLVLVLVLVLVLGCSGR